VDFSAFPSRWSALLQSAGQGRPSLLTTTEGTLIEGRQDRLVIIWRFLRAAATGKTKPDEQNNDTPFRQRGSFFREGKKGGDHFFCLAGSHAHLMARKGPNAPSYSWRFSCPTTGQAMGPDEGYLREGGEVDRNDAFTAQTSGL